VTTTAKKRLPKGYWREKQHRRDFFNEFAKEKGFDPSVPENWYSVTAAQISKKVTYTPKREEESRFKIIFFVVQF